MYKVYSSSYPIFLNHINTIYYNKYPLLYGGASKYRDKSSKSKRNTKPADVCTSCTGAGCDNCNYMGTLSMQVDAMARDLSEMSIGSAKPYQGDVVIKKAVQKPLKNVKQDRRVAHGRDCVAGTLQSCGMINQGAYNMLAELYPDGMTDEQIKALYEDILNLKVEFNETILKGMTLENAINLMLDKYIGNNTIRPFIIRTTTTNHSVLVGNYNGSPIIIDTQRVKPREQQDKVNIGKDEIRKYLSRYWRPGNIKGYVIFTQLESLSDLLTGLNI